MARGWRERNNSKKAIASEADDKPLACRRVFMLQDAPNVGSRIRASSAFTTATNKTIAPATQLPARGAPEGWSLVRLWLASHGSTDASPDILSRRLAGKGANSSL